MTGIPDLVVRDHAVRFNSEGLARLNDVWAAAGGPKNRLPADWMRLPSTQRLVNALLEKSTGKSHSWTNSEVRSVHYTKNGIGSFADVRLALAYAEYLDAKLAIEVREVFLRYKAADPVLACQSAPDKDPLSASNRDPSDRFELVRRSIAGQGCGAVPEQRACLG